MIQMPSTLQMIIYSCMEVAHAKQALLCLMRIPSSAVSRFSAPPAHLPEGPAQ